MMGSLPAPPGAIPPTPEPRRRVPRTFLVGLVIGAVIGSAATAAVRTQEGTPIAEASAVVGSASASAPASATPSSSSPSPPPSPSPSPSPAIVAPDPSAKFKGSCDYLLGNFTASEKGYRFVATANVTNDGNIGAVVLVTARWEQIGTNPVTAKEEVRVDVGRTETVRFTKVVTGDQIDLLQALDYKDQCSVNAKLVDTFGEPQA
jgi:hypothetical protein